MIRIYTHTLLYTFLLHTHEYTVGDFLCLISHVYTFFFPCHVLAGLSSLWGILCKYLSLTCVVSFTPFVIYIYIYIGGRGGDDDNDDCILNRCASICAIESNSNSDTRKLIAYWVFYSLISLFEHAFMKLLEW